MADYNIGGGAVIENSLNGKGIKLCQAYYILDGLSLSYKGTTQPYPTITSDAWRTQGHAYWLADGAIGTQDIDPLILAEINGIKLGVFLWCNNGNIPHGTYADNTNYNQYYIYFTLSDDEGIYQMDTAVNFGCITDYNGAIVGMLRQEYCYIMAISQGTKVYYHSCPWAEATYITPWLPLRFSVLDIGREANNSRSYVREIVDRNGVSLNGDELPHTPDDSRASTGSGKYDISSIPIGIPGLPGLGFANSGLGRLYTPDTGQLNQFAAWLYSDSIIDTIAKMWSNPLDLIVSLGIVPVTPTNVGSLTELKIGGVNSHVEMIPILNQYQAINCGDIDITEFYGSSLDYNETKISIYLPYVGVRELKTDEVMDGSLNVTYHIDLATGSCIAYVTCRRDRLNSVLYQFEGNVFVQMPLIARDFSTVYQSIIRSGVDAVTGGSLSSVAGAVDTAINVMNNKPKVSKSGGIGACGGLMGIRKPYIIIERPIQSRPEGYDRFYGIPSNITYTLNELEGMTVVDDLISNTLTCTKEEQEAIISKLKQGVII